MRPRLIKKSSSSPPEQRRRNRPVYHGDDIASTRCDEMCVKVRHDHRPHTRPLQLRFIPSAHACNIHSSRPSLATNTTVLRINFVLAWTFSRVIPPAIRPSSTTTGQSTYVVLTYSTVCVCSSASLLTISLSYENQLIVYKDQSYECLSLPQTPRPSTYCTKIAILRQ